MASTIHPGAIIVEALEREETWQQIVHALEHVSQQPNAADYMVNRVAEVSAEGVQAYELP